MKKKVLEIVESFGSGVYMMINDLCNELCSDFDIIIAYGNRPETPLYFKDDFNSKIKFIEIKNFTRKINIKKDFAALKEVRKIIKNEKPDIIHLHSSKAGVLGRIAANGKKYNMLYTPHGFSFLKQDDSKLKRYCYKMIEKTMTIINHECTIVGCSQGEYEEAKKISNNSIQINNGINTKKIKKVIETFPKYKVNFNNLKICTIGRIDYQKNPKLFNDIAKSLPKNKFTWIGDGELREDLSSPNICITGWKNSKEVLRELNKNDVFILTSLWEGLPIALLEAGYSKKICIVTNIIGNRDVIKNEVNGFLASNAEEFKIIINNLNIEKYRKISNEIFKNIEYKFNIKKLSEEYKKIYNKQQNK